MINMFSYRLKELRKSKKKTQQEMADFLGITRQGYAKYENGQAETDLETLKKLADYFSVSTDYLVGHTRDDIDLMTDEEVDEELKEAQKEMTVWYKNEPSNKRLKLRMIRQMIKSFEEDK